MTMSSLTTVDAHFNSSFSSGDGFYKNNSQIITEIYMPYAPSGRYDSTVSFLDDYTFPFDGHFLCMCCGSSGFKPEYDPAEYQVLLEEIVPLKREEIALMFNAI